MEIWDGYWEDGSLANIDLVRGEPIPNGIYHMVCEILVRHTDGDYLLMQRDFRKSNFGGYYEATAGGSALKGEDKITCAKRELFEETGIEANSLEEIFPVIQSIINFFVLQIATKQEYLFKRVKPLHIGGYQKRNIFSLLIPLI